MSNKNIFQNLSSKAEESKINKELKNYNYEDTFYKYKDIYTNKKIDENTSIQSFKFEKINEQFVNGEIFNSINENLKIDKPLKDILNSAVLIITSPKFDQNLIEYIVQTNDKEINKFLLLNDNLITEEELKIKHNDLYFKMKKSHINIMNTTQNSIDINNKKELDTFGLK